MYYFITSSKDTTISEEFPSGNFGYSSVLRVGNISGSTGYKKYRSLLYFDLDKFHDLEDDGTIANATYSIRLFDCYIENTNQPYDYRLELRPLSQAQFVEGKGINEKGYHSGAASWLQMNSATDWSWTGSVFYTQSDDHGFPMEEIVSQSFENGDEDFYADMKNYISVCSASVSGNYGFVLKLDGTQETGSDTRIVDDKRFFSRQSATIFKPRIEAKWDDSIADDKGRFKYGAQESNSLAYYHTQKEKLTDVSNTEETNAVYLRMYPSGYENTYYQLGATASKDSTGIYVATNLNITSSYTGGVDYWNLRWYSGAISASTLLKSEYITASSETIPSQLGDDELVIQCVNLKKTYSTLETARFDFFIRQRYPTYGFASGNEHLSSMIIPNMFYEIHDELDDSESYRFMKFDTQCTRLSYDKDSNYFSMVMSSFSSNRLYSIKLKYEIDNQVCIYSKKFKFAVVK